MSATYTTSSVLPGLSAAALTILSRDLLPPRGLALFATGPHHSQIVGSQPTHDHRNHLRSLLGYLLDSRIILALPVKGDCRRAGHGNHDLAHSDQERDRMR